MKIRTLQTLIRSGGHHLQQGDLWKVVINKQPKRAVRCILLESCVRSCSARRLATRSAWCARGLHQLIDAIALVDWVREATLLPSGRNAG